eukprot:4364122-Prymnesium_polylepis.1
MAQTRAHEVQVEGSGRRISMSFSVYDAHADRAPCFGYEGAYLFFTWRRARLRSRGTGQKRSAVGVRTYPRTERLCWRPTTRSIT